MTYISHVHLQVSSLGHCYPLHFHSLMKNDNKNVEPVGQSSGVRHGILKIVCMNLYFRYPFQREVRRNV
jgi:hypothetical protein